MLVADIVFTTADVLHGAEALATLIGGAIITRAFAKRDEGEKDFVRHKARDERRHAHLDKMLDRMAAKIGVQLDPEPPPGPDEE